MSNGKRWSEEWTLGSGASPHRVVAILGPLIYHEQTVEVVPKIEAEQRLAELDSLRSDLESLAQELEGRAEAEDEMRRKCLPADEPGLRDPVGAVVHATARDALREAAQLVRAEIEEGGK